MSTERNDYLVFINCLCCCGIGVGGMFIISCRSVMWQTNWFFFFLVTNLLLCYSTSTQTNGCVVFCYAVDDRGILPAIDVLGDNALVGVCSYCVSVGFYNATSFLDNTIVRYYRSIPKGIFSSHDLMLKWS